VEPDHGSVWSYRCEEWVAKVGTSLFTGVRGRGCADAPVPLILEELQRARDRSRA
jgi:hypothetical protein